MLNIRNILANFIEKWLKITKKELLKITKTITSSKFFDIVYRGTLEN